MEDQSVEIVIKKLKNLADNALDEIKNSSNLNEIESLRIKYLGRKSELTKILKSIKSFSTEQKIKLGQQSNFIKEQIKNKLENKTSDLTESKFKNIDTLEKIDVTLPKYKLTRGHIHPTTSTSMEVEDIFMNMGFNVFYPYLLDDDYHNFETLNIPPDHPARDSWDTFWSEDSHIAITHTSSMQNRILTSENIPIRAIVIGRCFRNEATDARHEHTFTQVEGIYVDKGISLPHMLGTLKEFFSAYYKTEVKVKFTPDFFPFVEPGGMMSLSCVLCQGKGCRVCKQSGWLELLGCGMIHPKVLKMANIDPSTYSGFAWGFGLERLIMLKYNINDIRLFNSGDLQFIRQF